MNSMETEAGCHALAALQHPLNSAPVIGEGGVDQPHVFDESLEADFFRAKRRTELKVGMQYLPGDGFVSRVPEVIVEPLD